MASTACVGNLASGEVVAAEETKSICGEICSGSE